MSAIVDVNALDDATTPLKGSALDKQDGGSAAGGVGLIPWIEKYRPQTLQDVVGNEETVLRLQAIAVDGNLPNLILSGPPGTGKVNRIFLQGLHHLMWKHSQTYVQAFSVAQASYLLPSSCSVFTDDIRSRLGPAAPREGIQGRRLGAQCFRCSWY